MIFFMKHQKGFTLIEALISLLILSIALLGFYKIHIKSWKLNGFNTQFLNAAYCAESKLERFKSLGYSVVENTVDGNDTCQNNYRQWTITQVSSNDIINTLRINIEVGWNTQGQCTDLDECEFQYELNTFICEDNMYK